MRQIRDMSILEIDITNACGHRCSNCTRFCGHHKQPYFMGFDTFKRAVDSLQEFPGLISIIGGEPMLHPEFSVFMDYIRAINSNSRVALSDGRSHIIVKDYLRYAEAQRWFNLSYNKGKGYNVFTSLPVQFYENYESVQSALTHMFLNDHSNVSMHQPILISRKDLGISDEEFAKLREDCWLQNFWSASITPKGGFFCEVAGTLDMLFNGPGGKKIEVGWWNHDLSWFEDQFHWCDICGMALSTFSRNANEELDDVSPMLLQKLKEVESPRIMDNSIRVYNSNSTAELFGSSLGRDMNSVSGNYEPDYNKRVSASAKNLRPHVLRGVIVLREMCEIETVNSIISKNKNRIKNFIIIVGTNVGEFCHYDDVKVIKVDCLGKQITYGVAINYAMKYAKKWDWFIPLKEDMEIPLGFQEKIYESYLNPGYLFKYKIESNDTLILFSPLSRVIKRAGFDRIAYCKNEQDFCSLWDNCIFELESDFDAVSDMNIEYFRNTIWKQYNSDETFKGKLKLLFERNMLKSNKILVTQSAFIYHTLCIGKLIEEMGYNITIIGSKKFEKYFEEWFENGRVFLFEEASFQFEKQEEFRNCIRDNYAGAIVPFSFGASTIKPIDNYTDALKTAENVSGKILAIINIRREFIEPEYGIWEQE